MRLSEKVQQRLETLVKGFDPAIKVGSPSLNFQDFRLDAPIWINDERKILQFPKEFLDHFFETPTFDQEVKDAINDLKGGAKKIRVTESGRTIIE